MGLIIPEDSSIDLDKLTLDYYLEATPIFGSEIKSYDMTGRNVYTIGSYTDSLGFGITSMDIDIKPNLQPVVNINFKDLYGNLVFNRNEDFKFDVLFQMPYPKFKLYLKGYLGKQISFLLQVKSVKTTYQPTDGSFEIKAEFVPNVFGFFNDIPYQYLFAVPYLKKKLGDPVSSDGQGSIIQIAKEGFQIQTTVKEVQDKYAGLRDRLTTFFANSKQISLNYNDGKINFQKIDGDQDLLDAGFTSLVFNIEFGAPSIATDDASLELFGSAILASINGSQRIVFKNNSDASKINSFVQSLEGQALIKRNKENIRRNLEIIQEVSSKQVTNNLTGKKIESQTIYNVMTRLAGDCAYILGYILEGGLNGYNNDPDRSENVDVSGYFYPTQDRPFVNSSSFSEQIPYPRARLEIDHVAMFVDALMGGVSGAQIVIDEFQQQGQNNTNNSTTQNQTPFKEELKRKISNLENGKENPYTSNVDQLIPNLIQRCGLISCGYSGPSISATNNGLDKEAVEKIFKNEFENLRSTVITLNSIGAETLKKFCTIVTTNFTRNGKIVNDGTLDSIKTEDGSTLRKYFATYFQKFNRANELDQFKDKNPESLISKYTYNNNILYYNPKDLYDAVKSISPEANDILGGKGDIFTYVTKANIQKKTPQNTGLKNPTPKSILFIGDSVTAIKNYSNGAAITGTYPNYVKSQLSSRGITVDVLAKGGEATKWMLDNLIIQLQSNKYDRIYFYGGINDAWNSSIKPQKTLDNVNKILDAIINSGADAFIIQGYNPDPFMDYTKMPVTRYQTGGITDNIPLIQEYKEYQTELEKLQTSRNDFVLIPKIDIGNTTGDGIHPNGTQHKKIAEVIVKTIDDPSQQQFVNNNSNNININNINNFQTEIVNPTNPVFYSWYYFTGDNTKGNIIKKPDTLSKSVFIDVKKLDVTVNNKVFKPSDLPSLIVLYDETSSVTGTQKPSDDDGIFRLLDKLTLENPSDWVVNLENDLCRSYLYFLCNLMLTEGFLNLPEQEREKKRQEEEQRRLTEINSRVIGQSSATISNSGEAKSNREETFKSVYFQFHHLCQAWISLANKDESGSIALPNDPKIELRNYLEEKYKSNDKTANFYLNFSLPLISKSDTDVDVREAIIDTEPLLENNTQTSTLNMMQNICSKNNFLLQPIPGGVTDDLDELFEPQPSVSYSVGNNALSVIWSPTPENRYTDNRNEPIYPERDFSNMPTLINSFKPIPLFQYGSPNNVIIKSIKAGTDDNKLTSDSIGATSQVVNNQNSNTKRSFNCSMLSVLQGRSYKISMDMLGNAQMYPTMNLVLDNIPIFTGLYWITEVQHKLTPNNMETTVEAVKMKYAGDDKFVSIPPITKRTAFVSGGNIGGRNNTIPNINSNPVGSGGSTSGGKQLDTNPKSQYPRKIDSRNGRIGNEMVGAKDCKGNELKLNAEAAKMFALMVADATRDGVCLYAYGPGGGYRSYETQDAIFDWQRYNDSGGRIKYKIGTVDTAAAYPGQSNHGWGTAIDFAQNNDLKTSMRPWLLANGEKYGWSWKEGRSVGEPWHFTYYPKLRTVPIPP